MSAHVPSIYAYIVLMMIIFIPVSILAIASYKRTPYLRNLGIILIGAAIVGGSTFYALGMVAPKSSARAEQNGTSSITGNVPLSKGAPIVKVMIHPGASAKGNPNFDPKIIKVSKGGGIIWTNNDNVPHIVTSFTDSGKSFDSSLIMPKKTYALNTAKLTEKTYNYFCTIHPFMKAKFTIGG